MLLQVDLLDLRRDPDLAERFAARVGVVFGGADGAGLITHLGRTAHIGIEHIGHGAGHVDVDRVADLEVGQGLGLFRQLEGHRLVVGALHRDLAAGQIDGQHLGGDMAFQRFTANRHISGLGREAASEDQRGECDSASERTNGFHRPASL
ncbi:hypothetical protein D3C81_1301450 [compost metagenome]